MSRTRSKRLGRSMRLRVFLGILISGILAVVIFMYSESDRSHTLEPSSANAIADWLRRLVFVVATSSTFRDRIWRESRRPPRHLHQRVTQFLFKHSPRSCWL